MLDVPPRSFHFVCTEELTFRKPIVVECRLMAQVSNRESVAPAIIDCWNHSPISWSSHGTIMSLIISYSSLSLITRENHCSVSHRILSYIECFLVCLFLISLQLTITTRPPNTAEPANTAREDKSKSFSYRHSIWSGKQMMAVTSTSVS